MVFEKVRDLLVEQLDADPNSITPETEIIDGLGADSLDVVELLMALEEEYDIQIPDEEVQNLKTVGDVTKYIEDRI